MRDTLASFWSVAGISRMIGPHLVHKANRRATVQRLAALGLGAWAFCSRGLAASPSVNGQGFFSTPLSKDSQNLGFALKDLDGRTVEATSLPGSLLVLFFGFLSCPSICPTTLMELSQARRAMGAEGRRVRLAFATLDPERDSAVAMRAWLKSFGDDLIGLRDSAGAIAKATNTLQLDWNRVAGSTPSSYTIDHGVQAYCFDTKGRLRLLIRPGPSPKEVAADWKRLLAGA